MRLFAAIDLPESVSAEVRAWWAHAGSLLDPSEWRDVPPRNWHLTLAFYGDVDGARVNDLCEALDECTLQQAPFSLRATGFGAFPNMLKPRVLWLGVEDAGGDGSLKALSRCCRQAGRATVRRRESGSRESPFKGHITLARGRGAPLPLKAEVLDSVEAMPESIWTAERMTLYQSILAPGGAQYRVVEEFEFRGS